MPAKLIVHLNNKRIDELVLQHNVCSIGRKADNDLRLEDVTVSSHHAVIETFDGDAYINDRNSTNGIYVNGERVKQGRLQSGDVIVLGQYTIEFVVLEDEPLSTELDPTQQIGKQELDRLLNKISGKQTLPPTRSPLASKRINWIAQNQTGAWFGFENQPAIQGDDWVDSSSRVKIMLKQESVPNPDWQDSLRKV